jgi:predicted dehydrogenase
MHHKKRSHIDFHGKLTKQPLVKIGFIGCGGHSFRNIYPTLQFVPVDLIATCDLSIKKAELFARSFGAHRAYENYLEMLDKEDLDLVLVVTGYDENGRPMYPNITIDCLKAGCNVWIEKPPAATCSEIESMQDVEREVGKYVVVGLKKMFFPANEKAKELMAEKDFGQASLLLLRYPLYIPTLDEFRSYVEQKQWNNVVGFLDHLCHPTSLLIFLFGMPQQLFYERAGNGSGIATFSYQDGRVASVALTCGSCVNAGMEHTTIVSDSGRHIVVENNIRVNYHRLPELGYGDAPNFFVGSLDETSRMWEPEYSLGQLYNKGLFLLGYYGEVLEIVSAILKDQKPTKGTLDQAWQVTRIFEAFMQGPGKVIPL